MTARGVEGDLLRLGVTDLLQPTPVTNLNIDRRFAQEEARREFRSALAKAPRPRANPGWRPHHQEKVVGRLGSHWFTARVLKLDEDGALVRWARNRQATTVAESAIVPVPPYAGYQGAAGQFVLVRPTTVSLPWAPHRIEAADGERFRVVDITGSRREVTLHDVIPLSEAGKRGM